jgi:hypothetical protein
MPGLPAAVVSALAPIPNGGAGAAIVPGTVMSVPAGVAAAPAMVGYQWYRSGKAIKGATGHTYKIKAADAGKQLTLKVTRQVGNLVEVLALRSVKVPRLTSKVKLSPMVRDGKPAVSVKVSVAGVKAPKGRVVVRAAGQRITVKLRAALRGKAVVRLPKTPKGKTVKITVSYKGNSQVKSATVRAKGQWS